MVGIVRSASRLRIGINAHVLGMKAGGDRSYLRNVIRALGHLDSVDDYTLFLSPPFPEEPILGAERMHRVEVRPYNPLVRTPITFPLALARERIDVLHVLYIAPPLCPTRVVVTIHDISYEHYPQFFTPTALRQMRLLVPLTIRHAKAVLTVSEFSKMDIVRRYCVAPEKIVVTPLAPDPMFRPLHDATRLARVRERYGTGDRFILCVGNLQPRKNLKTLIDAYTRLRRADTTRHKLVLVGRKAWLYDDTFAVARDSGYAGDLVFTDYVSDADLVALYNSADLFVYPSIFEGFGLPPLEAMACGTPVITSNTSSLPEVVGDAAPMINPLDGEGLAAIMAATLNDAHLREHITALGLRRAAAFSWESTARRTLDVYHRASR